MDAYLVRAIGICVFIVFATFLVLIYFWRRHYQNRYLYGHSSRIIQIGSNPTDVLSHTETVSVTTSSVSAVPVREPTVLQHETDWTPVSSLPPSDVVQQTPAAVSSASEHSPPPPYQELFGSDVVVSGKVAADVGNVNARF